MKKLGAPFYIVLAALTAAVLGCLGLYVWLEDELWLYLMLGVFAVYLVHLIASLAWNSRSHKRAELDKSSFLLLAGNREAVVYLTYLGSERHIRRPSARRKDYLVEFYDGKVDVSLLKRHLWFGLSEEEEKTLNRSCLGGMRIPYPLLRELSGRTLLVQAGLYEAAKDSPLFSGLFGGNQVIIYGETA